MDSDSASSEGDNGIKPRARTRSKKPLLESPRSQINRRNKRNELARERIEAARTAKRLGEASKRRPSLYDTPLSRPDTRPKGERLDMSLNRTPAVGRQDIEAKVNVEQGLDDINVVDEGDDEQQGAVGG